MVEYRTIGESVDDATVKEIGRLYFLCFSREPEPDFGDRLREKPGLLLNLASAAGQVVGYKVGYRRYGDVFYSWLGGVAPAYRRRGIARQLLKEQHQWCKDTGYRWIVAENRNDLRRMLLLNIQEGFNVIGTYLSERSETIITLRKSLEESHSGDEDWAT